MSGKSKVFLIYSTCILMMMAAAAASEQAEITSVNGKVMLDIADSIVYDTAYTLQSGGWTALSLQGGSKLQNWFIGSATGEVTFEESGKAYIAFFSCAQQGNGWDCHGGSWQILTLDFDMCSQTQCFTGESCIAEGQQFSSYVCRSGQLVTDDAKSVELLSAIQEGEDVIIDFDTVGYVNGDQDFHVHFTNGDELLEMYYGESPAVLSGHADQLAETKTLCAYVADPTHKQIGDTQCVPVEENEIGNGLRGDYYSDIELQKLIGSRIDTAVNFDWGAEPAFPGGPKNNFGVRWEGEILIEESGAHTFYLDVDDGARLYIDNQMVINSWEADQASGQVTLSPGLHVIRVEYHDTSGDASIVLSWAPPDQEKHIVPQRVLFGGQDLNNPPEVTLTTPADGTEFSVGDTVTLTAQASDANGVGRVEFKVNGDLVATDETAPYSATWQAQAKGQYEVVATAFDTRAAQASTQPVHISVDEEVVEIPSGTLLWSDSATWGGTKPQAGEDVFIAEDQKIIVDESTPRLGGIQVRGELHFADKDVHLQANYVHVFGDNSLLQIGSPQKPFADKATITLLGTDEDKSKNVDFCGYKSICTGNGARLELHGEVRYPTWTRLRDGSPANPGDTSITLQESVAWIPGDEIVIVSTDYDPGLAEQRTITRVQGNTVHFDEPLEFVHFAETQTWDGVELDQRAEVLHLTRNIKIQGDENSEVSGFGGHLLNINPHASEQFGRWRGGAGEEFVDIWEDYENPAEKMPHVSGVEFYRMGQQGVLARYPFHWHMYGDATGSYLKDSSIHRTYQRCVTIHGTMNALVENNVAFDAVGHCFFWEDGIETGNTVRNNVGALIRNYWDEDKRLIESDDRPAVFWITNKDNTVTGNVAAGAFGFGFWYDIGEHPTGPSSTEQVSLRDGKFGTFDNNRAHSIALPYREDGVEHPRFTIENEPDSGAGLFAEKLICNGHSCDFNNFQTYRNDVFGFWSDTRGSSTLRNSILADNPRGAKVRGFVSDTVFVADTGMRGNPEKAGEGVASNGWDYLARKDKPRKEYDLNTLHEYERAADRSLPMMPEMVFGPDKLSWVGQKVHYTGTVSKDLTYIGYTDDETFDRAAFQHTGTGEEHLFWNWRIKLIDSEDLFILKPEFNGNDPRQFIIQDGDGSISGAGEYREYRYYDYYDHDRSENYAYYYLDDLGDDRYGDIFMTPDCTPTGEPRLFECTTRAARTSIKSERAGRWTDIGNKNVLIRQASTGYAYGHTGSHTALPIHDTYNFEFPSGYDVGPVKITLSNTYPDDWVAYSFPYESEQAVKSEATVVTVNSLDALYASDASIASYYDSANKRQYLKVHGTTKLKNEHPDRLHRVLSIGK